MEDVIIIEQNCLVPLYALRYSEKAGLEYDNKGDTVSNEDYRIEEALRFFDDKKPNIALLQEVFPELEEAILKHYPSARVYSAYKDNEKVCASSIVIFTNYPVLQTKELSLKYRSTAMIVSVLVENKELTLCSLHLKGSAEDDTDYIYGLGDLSTIVNELASFPPNQIVGGDYNKNLLSERSFRRQSMENAKFTLTILGNFYKNSNKLLSAVFFKGDDVRLKGGEWFDEYKISDHLGLVYKFRV